MSTRYGIPSRIDGKRNPEYSRLHNKYHHQLNKDKHAKDKSFGGRYYGSTRLNAWKHQGVNIDNYGQFLTLLAMAQFKCEICRKTLTEKTAHLDHNHETGKVNGILCQGCNNGIGLIKRPVHLLNAGLYLYNNRELSRCQELITTAS